MEAKIHVANINYKVSIRELKVFLSKFGAISSCFVARDKFGRSKGFGFVIFKESQSAENALKAVKDDLILEKRTLKLNYYHSEDKKVDLKKRKKQNKKKLKNPSKDCKGHDQHVSLPTVTSCDALYTCAILPDDVLLLIFTYLKLVDLFKVERVCQRWYSLVQTHWKCKRSLQFRNFFGAFSGALFTLTDELFLKILKKTCGNLQCLDLSASAKTLSDYAFDKLGIMCPRLHTLNLAHCKISQNSSRFLSSKLPCLKCLTLRSCTLSEKSLWWFLHNSPCLEYLDVEENRDITGKCFFVSSGKLKTVIMNECIHVENESLQLLAQKNKDLEVLEMNNCSKVSLESLVFMSKICTKLKVLEVSDLYRRCGTLGPPGSNMFCSLVNLQVIVLNFRELVTDETLAAIGKHCPILRKISLEGCLKITDTGICDLCLSGSSLKDVNISLCVQISDYSIFRLSSCCVSLNRLVARNCLEISNQSIVTLIQQCLHITEIDLSACVNITSKLLSELDKLDFNESATCRLKRILLSLGGTRVTQQSIKEYKRLPKFCDITFQSFSHQCRHCEFCVCFDIDVELDYDGMDDWWSDSEDDHYYFDDQYLAEAFMYDDMYDVMYYNDDYSDPDGYSDPEYVY